MGAAGVNDRYDQQRLLDYVEQELSPADEAAFEAQLAGDPAMRRLVAQLRVDRDRLRAAADQPAPAGLMERANAHIERQMLMGGLPQQTEELRGRRSAHMARWIAVGGLAAMLLVSVALLAWMFVDTGSLNDAAVETLPRADVPAPMQQPAPPARGMRQAPIGNERGTVAEQRVPPTTTRRPSAMAQRSVQSAVSDRQSSITDSADPAVTANTPGAVETAEPRPLDVIVRVPTARTPEIHALLTAWARDAGGVVSEAEDADADDDEAQSASLSIELPASRWPGLLELLRGRQANGSATAVAVRWQAPRRGARVVMLEALHAMGMTAPPREPQPLHVRVDFDPPPNDHAPPDTEGGASDGSVEPR